MATKPSAKTSTATKTAVKDPNKIILSGKAMYAMVKDPNPGYKGGPDKWRVDLLLNTAELAKAKKAGARVRGAGGTPSQNAQFEKYRDFCKEQKFDQIGYTGEYVRFEQATERKTADGTVKKYNPPRLYDGAGNEITIDLKVGNGSDLRVTGTLRKGAPEDPMVFGSYSLSLGYITINKLVEYAPVAQDVFDITKYQQGNKQGVVAQTPHTPKAEDVQASDAVSDDEFDTSSLEDDE